MKTNKQKTRDEGTALWEMQMSQSLTKKEHGASLDKVTKLVLAINMRQSLVDIIMQKYLTL